MHFVCLDKLLVRRPRRSPRGDTTLIRSQPASRVTPRRESRTWSITILPHELGGVARAFSPIGPLYASGGGESDSQCATDTRRFRRPPPRLPTRAAPGRRPLLDPLVAALLLATPLASLPLLPGPSAASVVRPSAAPLCLRCCLFLFSLLLLRAAQRRFGCRRALWRLLLRLPQWLRPFLRPLALAVQVGRSLECALLDPSLRLGTRRVGER